MMRALFTISIFLISGHVKAQNFNYSVLTLPDSLRKSAAMVIRHHSKQIEVKSDGEATIEELRVITLLNKSSTSDARFVEYEDAFRKLTSASIRVYDIFGKEIKSYKKKQLEKTLVDDGISFVTNAKSYYFEVPIPSFPITIAFETTLQTKGFLDFDDFYAQYSQDAVQYAEYTITAPKNNPIRYKAYNTDIKPTITGVGDRVVYKWSVVNVKPLGFERNSFRNDGIPRVYITPTNFKMDDYNGSFASWAEYGKWYYSLCKNAYDFSPAQQSEIMNLVKGLTEPKQIISKLYSYMQRNCRYVGIQLGIGGFKPINNSHVHKTKYGDCKALTAYMQAMLKVLNIESHQALINAGARLLPVDPDFANHQFNHVILCVPNNRDTIWLECTSQDNAAGELGAFTENKLALLCTDQGGVLVATPKSVASNNVLSSSTTVKIDTDFTGEAVLQLKSSGEFASMLNAYLVSEDIEAQKAFLFKKLLLKPSSYIENEGVPAATNVSYKIFYDKAYDFFVGQKYFLRRHLYALNSTVLPADSNRLNDYNMEYPYFKSDTTVYQFNSILDVESGLGDTKLQCKLAEFNSTVAFDGNQNKITIISSLQLFQHKIPATLYSETKQFFDNVNGLLGKKIVVKAK
jgi:hypothetical protein